MAAIAVLAVASSSAKPAMKYRRQWIQRIDEHIYTTVKRIFPHLRADKSAEGVKLLRISVVSDQSQYRMSAYALILKLLSPALLLIMANSP